MEIAAPEAFKADTGSPSLAAGLARPPGAIFYGAFGATVILLLVPGTTELRDWGGTNLPNTGAEMASLLGWGLVQWVFLPVFVLRLIWAAARGQLRGAAVSDARLGWLRWFAAPVVTVLLWGLTTAEVIPELTRHPALGDPVANLEEASAILAGGLDASGLGALPSTAHEDSLTCDGYPHRRYDLVEHWYEGLSFDEAQEYHAALSQHWVAVADQRGWESSGDLLYGDGFNFAASWSEADEAFVVSVTTPCTRR